MAFVLITLHISVDWMLGEEGARPIKGLAVGSKMWPVLVLGLAMVPTEGMEVLCKAKALRIVEAILMLS